MLLCRFKVEDYEQNLFCGGRLKKVQHFKALRIQKDHIKLKLYVMVMTSSWFLGFRVFMFDPEVLYNFFLTSRALGLNRSE